MHYLVLGCGSIGQRHIGNLLDLGVSRLAAYDTAARQREAVAARFRIPVHDSLSPELLAAMDAVLICTPTYLHLEHGLLAARAGCHFFMEKPVFHKETGTDELIGLVEEKALKTLVGCNFRFHPGLRLVKSLLAEERIGPIVSARARYGQYLPDCRPFLDYRKNYSAHRRQGGGVLLDRIHELDYLYWLLGDISQIMAMTGKLSRLEMDAEDTADILLRFECGTIGSIHLDYVRRQYDCGLELVGEEGIIQWTYQDHRVCWFEAGDGGVWQSKQWAGYDGNNMYLEEMRHFLDILAGRSASEQDIGQACRLLKIWLRAGK